MTETMTCVSDPFASNGSFAVATVVRAASGSYCIFFQIVDVCMLVVNIYAETKSVSDLVDVDGIGDI
jgi:hypothetical protein